MIKTVNEVIIAFDYTRVVHGRRGDYAEFSGDQINTSSLKKILDNTIEKNGFYDEYRTKKDGIKVYFQVKHVGYADYKPGFYYISVNDLLYKFPNSQLKLEDFARENQGNV